MTAGAESPLLFQCRDSTLPGILHSVSGPTAVAIVIVVGGPQYRVGSHRQFVSTARALASAGHPVLRFDYRGMGDAEGSFLGFEHVADDIRAAVDAVVGATQPSRGVVLMGLCDAASAVLGYCCSDNRIAGLVLMNPWVRTEKTQAAAVVRHYYAKRILQPEFWRKLASGKLSLRASMASLAANLSRLTRRSRGSPQQTGYIDAMRRGFTDFTGPVLLVQSGRDLTAAEFRNLCRGNSAWSSAVRRATVEIHDMPEADHTFSLSAHLNEFNSRCSGWLDRTFRSVACR